MAVSASEVKQLRDLTGAGVMECKRALEEANGDIQKAAELLKEWGASRAEKRAGREASQGLVDCYIHAGGRIGTLVEVNCETDFVARTDAFRELVHDIAMQVAATAPVAVNRDDLPEGVEGDPKDLVLLEQPFIKDPGRTIQDLITEVIAKTGENIQIRRFARYELGE